MRIDLMKYHNLFFSKIKKDFANLLSAEGVIGASELYYNEIWLDTYYKRLKTITMSS